MKKAAMVIIVGIVLSALSASGGAQADEERIDYFKKWLDEDVVYIITDQERDVFERLSTPEEKEQFIEQFWLRRDPDPSTAINEFKEEHYRRIAYANDHYKSGVDGWTTDRGRIYITFGPPTSIERSPSGGMYERPMSEGGGMTSTYPYEVWFYNHIEGVGSGIEIEFVDPTGSGEYRIALHESEKDALLYIPGGGNTLFEELGLESRAGRIRSALAMRNLGLQGDPAMLQENPFTRLERYFALTRPPSIHFDDLKQVVESHVFYDSFPVDLRFHIFRYSADKVLCPLTIEISNNNLTFEQSGHEPPRAKVHIYGRVQDLGHHTVYEFEDILYSKYTNNPNTKSLYQKLIPLRPGHYKVNLVLKDTRSGSISNLTSGLIIPRPSPNLSLSSILLARKVMGAAPGEYPPDPFVTPGGLKIYPAVDGEFQTGEPIGIYMEVYNFETDGSSSLPDIRIGYKVQEKSTGRVYPEGTIPPHAIATLEKKISVAYLLDRLEIPAGEYLLSLTVTDRISGEKVEDGVAFELAAPK